MDVKVKAEKSGDGSIAWTIDGKRPKDSVIDVGKKSPPTELDFKLTDKAKAGLRFDCARPFDVDENANGDCPPDGIHTREIAVLECSRHKLKILDRNINECTLHYQLNFVDGAGKQHVVDPEIRNGGGGGNES
jgi:hypothetical protein